MEFGGLHPTACGGETSGPGVAPPVPRRSPGAGSGGVWGGDPSTLSTSVPGRDQGAERAGDPP